MFREALFKGKELAGKVTNYVMNYSEIEAKVREATNSEAWGPHGALMQEISEYTFTSNGFQEVMSMIWKRIFPENSPCWRRQYKALTLLAYLIKNGSEHISLNAREHIFDIRTLESFQYIDEAGKDQGLNIRHKASEIIELLLDSKKLAFERQNCKKNRSAYRGFSSSVDFSSNQNMFDDFNRESLNRDLPENVKITSVGLANPPLGRLGSFDEWRLGKERGITEDVKDVMKEFWNIAKTITQEMLTGNESDQTDQSNEITADFDKE